ncbi:GntR family transcriptional regulator [Bradyrhizobium sp. 1.29L]
MFQGKRWEFVKTQIEESIASKSFAPGEKPPNDVDLARLYGVNRHTVRYAIRALEEKGILRVEQGRGTFVVENTTPYLLSANTRLTTTSSLMAIWPAEKCYLGNNGCGRAPGKASRS